PDPRASACRGDGAAVQLAWICRAETVQAARSDGRRDICGMARVLIVDDDPAIRDVVRFALERAGFQTSEAANGKAALACFAAARPDLVVLDILMPELDGIEVCREIRRTGPTPVVFLSSKDEEVDRIVGLELGGDDYLVKP